MEDKNVLAKRYQLEIKNIQGKLKEAYKDLNERQRIEQNLIMTMIKNVKREHTNKIVNLRQILTKIKSEPTGPSMKKIFNEQYQKITKLSHKNNAFECLPSQDDISGLYTIKTNILKMEKVVSTLISFCQYLNPLKMEENYLHQCIADKIRHIHLQIPIIVLEFRAQLSAILDSMKRCINEETAGVDRNINNIILNLRKFRNKRDY